MRKTSGKTKADVFLFFFYFTTKCNVFFTISVGNERTLSNLL